MDRDVARFDRWAESYDTHHLQRLVFEPVQKTLLEEAVAARPDAKAILDVGCGTGRLLRSAASVFPAARLEGVDAAPSMIKQALASVPSGGPINFQVAVAEQLPFGGGEFDLVFSTMTFHHWESQSAGIGEIARVLAPGGRWLLADFLARGFMRFVRRLFRLRRFPERRGLERMLAQKGMAIVDERLVPGLGGQVPILVIGRSEGP